MITPSCLALPQDTTSRRSHTPKMARSRSLTHALIAMIAIALAPHARGTYRYLYSPNTQLATIVGYMHACILVPYYVIRSASVVLRFVATIGRGKSCCSVESY